MEIKEITFDEIKTYWEKYLWPEYSRISNRIDTTIHEIYCYDLFKYLSQSVLERMIPATYIGYFIDEKIVGVESGYKTNHKYYRLRGLWVDENHRRSGIATDLVKYLENKSDQKFLWTTPRESSFSFYLEYGFKMTGEYRDEIYGKTYFAIKERE